MALAVKLREEGVTLQRIGETLGVSREAVRKWLSSDAAQVFRREVKEKSLARPRAGGVAKRRPKNVILPSAISTEPWWKIAPPVVAVNIPSGDVLVWRWPLPDA